VVCLDNPSEENDFVTLNKLFASNKIRVPGIYDYDVKKGYILEEDLGDMTLLKYLASLGSREDEYKIYHACIEELVKINSLGLDKIKGLSVEKRSFDFEKLMAESRNTIEYFVLKYLKETRDEIIYNIESGLRRICKLLSDARPLVICHRDYHSRNLMVKDGEVCIIDYQDARLGLPQYDLVSLLEDCYYSIDNENKKKLIAKYYDETKTGQTFDEFCYLYDLMAVQRVFKAIGSFAMITELRKDYRYLKYIGFAMEKLRFLLFKHEEFSLLRKSIFESYHES